MRIDRARWGDRAKAMISASAKRIDTRLPFVVVPLAFAFGCSKFLERSTTWSGIMYLGDDDGRERDDGDNRETGDAIALSAAHSKDRKRKWAVEKVTKMHRRMFQINKGILFL
jgi:hypothetical protein